MKGSLGTRKKPLQPYVGWPEVGISKKKVARTVSLNYFSVSIFFLKVSLFFFCFLPCSLCSSVCSVSFLFRYF